jgi:hypothetical protein
MQLAWQHALHIGVSAGVVQPEGNVYIATRRYRSVLLPLAALVGLN